MKDLNERQIKIVEILTLLKKTSAKDLSSSLNCSTKTVYQDLKIVSSFFENYGIKVIKKPRIGIFLSGAIDRNRVLKDLHYSTNLLNSDEGRKEYILLELLHNDKPISVESLSEKMFLSSKSINQYLNTLDASLREIGVKIDKKPHIGISLNATEDQKRTIIFRLLSYYWKDQWIVKDINSENNYKYLGIGNSTILSKELVQKAIKIISAFLKEEKINLTDYQFQSLAIHIAIAVKRIKDGNLIETNEVLKKAVEDKAWLKPAQKLAKNIEKSFDIKIPNQEIKYLEIHLMATDPTSIKIKHSNITDDLKKLLGQTGYDNELLTNLYIHLISTIKRLKVGATITNPYRDKIIYRYHQAFDNAIIISDYFSKKYNVDFNDDEIAYIAMHLEAFYERNRIKDGKTNVAIVCSTGLGSAQLLAARVRHTLPNLNIVGIWSVGELSRRNLEKVDIILSTLQLQNLNKKVFVVSPLLDSRSKKEIQDYISQGKKKRSILDLIDHRLIFINPNISSSVELITFIGKKLEKLDYATKELVPSAIRREQVSSTGTHYYAMPHGNPKYVKSPIISITILKKPIRWGNTKVSFVMLMALTQNLSQPVLDSYFDQIYALITNRKLITRICKEKNVNDVLNLIKEGVKSVK